MSRACVQFWWHFVGAVPRLVSFMTFISCLLQLRVFVEHVAVLILMSLAVDQEYNWWWVNSFNWYVCDCVVMCAYVCVCVRERERVYKCVGLLCNLFWYLDIILHNACLKVVQWATKPPSLVSHARARAHTHTHTHTHIHTHTHTHSHTHSVTHKDKYHVFGWWLPLKCLLNKA